MLCAKGHGMPFVQQPFEKKCQGIVMRVSVELDVGG